MGPTFHRVISQLQGTYQRTPTGGSQYGHRNKGADLCSKTAEVDSSAPSLTDKVRVSPWTEVTYPIHMCFLHTLCANHVTSIFNDHLLRWLEGLTRSGQSVRSLRQKLCKAPSFLISLSQNSHGCMAARRK